MQKDVYVPPSFTPINQPGSHRSFIQTVIANSSNERTNQVNRPRQHNSVVAQYLGLGSETEPPSLEKYARALPKTSLNLPSHGCKRSRNKTRPRYQETKLPKQTRIPDGLRVTKPGLKTTARKGKVTGSVIAEDVSESSSTLPDIDSEMPIVSSRTCVAHAHTDDHGQDTFTDDGIDDIFNLIDFDDMTNHPSTDAGPANENHLVLTSDMSSDFSSFSQPSASEDRRASAPLLEFSVSSRSTDAIHSRRVQGTRTFISLVTSSTPTLSRVATASPNEERKPVVRCPFPSPVRDRSPIIGLSSNQLLRTCFRIGEAINQACHAAKHGQNIVYELYARVLSSERDAAKQHFVFSDLFHDKPPYVKGRFEAAIWRQVELYNYDSGRLLDKKRMCRCIGQIKRDGKEWIMNVVNIWEATWEDIAWVEGIVNA